MIDNIKNKIKEIFSGFSFLIDNVFDFINILCAILLVIIHFCKPEFLTPERLISTTIAMLSLNALSSFQSRQQWKKSFPADTENIAFFDNQTKAEINDHLKRAEKVYMIGNGLRSSIVAWSTVISDRKKEAQFRFILMDFRKTASVRTMVDMYSGGSKNIGTSRASIKECIRRVANMIISSTAECKAEVGLYPSTARHGMIIIDPDKSKGLIYLKLYLVDPFRDKPMIIVRKSKDRILFDKLVAEAELMWDRCKTNSAIYSKNQMDDLKNLL